VGRLDGKIAIITGGASGIGEATTRLFVEEGARVVVADVLDERGRHLADELGESARFRHTDVSREVDVEALIDDTLEEFGRLDCLFNNAGIGGPRGPIESIPLDGFEKVVGVLFRGTFLGMKHAAPAMKRQGSGSIINNASTAGLQSGFGPHVYSAAKAAIIQLTRSVAAELGESGVRVNCICPGYIATPIFGRGRGVPEAEIDRTVELVKLVFASLQPIGRTGLPEDIARAALWLASDDSSFVNGHALVVDGGVTCGKMWSDYQAILSRIGSVLSQKSK